MVLFILFLKNCPNVFLNLSVAPPHSTNPVVSTAVRDTANSKCVSTILALWSGEFDL